MGAFILFAEILKGKTTMKIKLTAKDIVEIKCALSRNVPRSHIAKIFKVTDSHICDIANNKIPKWANIGNAKTWKFQTVSGLKGDI